MFESVLCFQRVTSPFCLLCNLKAWKIVCQFQATWKLRSSEDGWDSNQELLPVCSQSHQRRRFSSKTKSGADDAQPSWLMSYWLAFSSNFFNIDDFGCFLSIKSSPRNKTRELFQPITFIKAKNTDKKCALAKNNTKTTSLGGP